MRKLRFEQLEARRVLSTLNMTGDLALGEEVIVHMEADADEAEVRFTPGEDLGLSLGSVVGLTGLTLDFSGEGLVLVMESDEQETVITAAPGQSENWLVESTTVAPDVNSLEGLITVGEDIVHADLNLGSAEVTINATSAIAQAEAELEVDGQVEFDLTAGYQDTVEVISLTADADPGDVEYDLEMAVSHAQNVVVIDTSTGLETNDVDISLSTAGTTGGTVFDPTLDVSIGPPSSLEFGLATVGIPNLDLSFLQDSTVDVESVDTTMEIDVITDETSLDVDYSRAVDELFAGDLTLDGLDISLNLAEGAVSGAGSVSAGKLTIEILE